ncbi:MAG TPA: fatty acyl-AMP ligase [Labilithrix sp.]|nr:fatty acyl-AMP ligase [Labilithrix sp.]
MSEARDSARVFRETFPPESKPGFRSALWMRGVPKPMELYEPLHPTLVSALMSSAASPAVGMTLIPEDVDAPEEFRSYAELLADAKRAARALLAVGVRKGDPVLIVLQTSFDFPIIFFGIILAGGIPVPCYPPAVMEKVEVSLARLGHIARDCGAKICVTEALLSPMLGGLAQASDRLMRITTVERLLKSTPLDASLTNVVVEPNDIAFIQYTSGSTGHPKGVAIRHGNVCANLHAGAQAARVNRHDRLVSWCPLYHDLGLVGGLLYPIFMQLPLALMAPTTFLLRPIRWLQAIQKHRATVSMGPNFAYALCARRVRPSEREGLDLSTWRLAYNGAEPINVASVQEFTKAFAPYGFRAEAMFPVYGMAECTLGITTVEPGSPLRYESVDRAALAEGDVILKEGAGAMHVVSVGKPLPGHEMLVVDEMGDPVDERVVGHIVVRGPSLMKRYFNNPEATATALRAGSLWTGDLGYLSGGELYITGRAKDIIIIRGHNYYAEDIENVAERVTGIRGGGTAAFAVYDEERAIDLVVIVCEARVKEKAEREKLAESVIRAVVDETGMILDEVVIVAPRTIPKTSSGKRQRALTRERYLKKALDASTGSSRLRMAMVFVRSGIGRFTLRMRRLGSA